MKNLYYTVEITNDLFCAFEDCEDQSSFQYSRDDLALSEVKAIDLDEIEQLAEQTHRNWEWKKMNGEWYCPSHATIDETA